MVPSKDGTERACDRRHGPAAAGNGAVKCWHGCHRAFAQRERRLLLEARHHAYGNGARLLPRMVPPTAGTAPARHGVVLPIGGTVSAGVRGGANAVGRCPPEWNDGRRTAASIDAAARRGGATPWNGAWSVPARARMPSARSGLLGDRAGILKAAAANALRVHPGPPVAAGPDILVFGH